MSKTSRSLSYVTVIGKHYSLAELNEPERAFLHSCIRSFQTARGWEAFASSWRPRFFDLKWPLQSTVFRCCEDLETRLRFRERSEPIADYRHLLVDAAREKYGSLTKFCDDVGIDKGHLSRVLAGDSDLSTRTLTKVFSKLGLVVWARSTDDLRESARFDPVSVLDHVQEEATRE